MSLHIANGIYIQNYAALTALLKNLSDNFTINGLFNSTDVKYCTESLEYVTNIPTIRTFFYCIYVIIFLLGICGNILVCYVVFRNRSMHTVTNLFITNLGLSDILLCIFAVPFTPLYIFMQEWIFGRTLCHLLPYVQGVSVYISAFTLMSIAIDRFFVIIYPLKSRLRLNICCIVIISIWISGALLTLPYGIYMKVICAENGRLYCDEVWPYESYRRAFGFTTSTLQFVVPFLIITFCYMKVCGKLNRRVRSKPGRQSLRKEEFDKERTRRTNRMLISMVIIFGACWLPINICNLLIDFYIPATNWKYLSEFFFLCHAIAMSSTCYNPFLYAWLNENFRKEFKVVLPCFSRQISAVNREALSMKQIRICNGHETTLETLLPQNNSSLETKTEADKLMMSVKYIPNSDILNLPSEA